MCICVCDFVNLGHWSPEKTGKEIFSNRKKVSKNESPNFFGKKVVFFMAPLERAHRGESPDIFRGSKNYLTRF